MAHDSLNPDNDPFAPPVISTEVHCIHCGEEYDSYRIEWRVERDSDGQSHGFWCCPMEGCDGKGFGFDIFPVDPEYRDENGELMWCNDGDEFDDDEEDIYFKDRGFAGSEFVDSQFVELGGDEKAEDEWLEEDEAPARGAGSEPEEDVPY